MQEDVEQHAGHTSAQQGHSVAVKLDLFHAMDRLLKVTVKKHGACR